MSRVELATRAFARFNGCTVGRRNESFEASVVKVHNTCNGIYLLHREKARYGAIWETYEKGGGVRKLGTHNSLGAEIQWRNISDNTGKDYSSNSEGLCAELPI